MPENYYNVLGVDSKASKDEIKKAYRALQMKYHPDKNPGNQECITMTQKINEAYEILGDEQKRAEYDSPNPFSAHGINMNMSGDPLNDIFSMMFGGHGFPPGFPPGFPHQGFPPGAKIHVFHGGGPMGFQQAMDKPIPIIKNIQVTMEQVFSGASVPVEIERWILENGNKVFENETIYVNIPQGIDDNEMIILRDRGNVISEQFKGDIKIVVSVENKTQFKRHGLDLILDKTISLKEALCGFSFELKYINGKSYTMNNNKGSIIPPEYKKVYPEMGIKRGEHKGNLIIFFHIEFPEKLTDEQIDKLNAIL